MAKCRDCLFVLNERFERMAGPDLQGLNVNSMNEQGRTIHESAILTFTIQSI